MTAKKTAAPSIMTVSGAVTIDPAASYRLTLAKAIKAHRHVMRPDDRNIEVTGEALLALAADAPEGAIVDAAQV